MKIKSKAIGHFALIAIFFTAVGTLSACKSFSEVVDEFMPTIDHMNYTKYDTHYVAGDFEYGYSCETYFIPASINYIPVTQLGYHRIIGEGAGFIRRNTSLSRLYLPGSIQAYYPNYVHASCPQLKIFYCGTIYTLSDIAYDNHKIYQYYVPAEFYSEFENKWEGEGDQQLLKANISYNLNAEELPRYYYVDNVDYGETIINIPPMPERKGYKFVGWYTESECINQWSFDNAMPQPAEGEDFRELCLYAKWRKN